MMPICKILSKSCFFLLGIFGSVVLAALFPWIGSLEGPLYPAITVKYGAVSLLSFSSGVSCPKLENPTSLRDICPSGRNYKLYLFIQFFWVALAPCIVRLLLFLFIYPFGLDNWILTGIIAVSCMPPSITSAVALTKTAEGNKDGAIYNSVLSFNISILMTPFLLYIHGQLKSTLPAEEAFKNVILTIIVPFVAGLGSQSIIRRLPWLIGTVSNVATLFIVYASFCDSFLKTDVTIDTYHVLVTIITVFCIQLLLLYLSARLSVRLSFPIRDIIVIIFFCTHKSIMLGLPILKAINREDTHISHIILPLLIYESVQLILAALIAPSSSLLLLQMFDIRESRILP